MADLSLSKASSAALFHSNEFFFNICVRGAAIFPSVVASEPQESPHGISISGTFRNLAFFELYSKFVNLKIFKNSFQMLQVVIKNFTIYENIEKH